MQNVAAVQEDTPLISVLNIFIERRISALPVIDSEGKVVDIYAKYDVINLAREGTYSNLDVSVSAAKGERPATIRTCTKDDTLGDIIERIVKARVHRLVIVDSLGPSPNPAPPSRRR